ncbi:D-alanyl-lipoteichoic acid biosynthesis protein DltD [Listeria aquatica]|uniref:D-alanyl-lipoteichoic acid biosynthesis protein DltD n=1 Tax=Listeria aquatica TaxID=1494960 RepID=UPI0031F4F15D
MKKKLWMIFGPILVAGFIFLFILFGPSAIFGGVSERAVSEGATSMSPAVVGGEEIQRVAFESDKYLPIFGSSELSRIDPLHPSVFAKKYKTGYTPFLIGRPGTQSLYHYLDINMLENELKNKKVVFILSPQWFQPKGVDDNHFGATFSPIQAYTFALQDEKETPERRYAARRLLSFKVVQNDSTLSKLLENIATIGPNKPHSPFLTKRAGEIQYRVLKRKDELQSKFVTGSKQAKIDKEVKQLPDQPNFKELDELAKSLGEKQTDNNDFHVKNHYYTKKIKPIEEKLKDSKKDLSYVESPEYDDLQLMMDALKKVHADVLFVNPPINREWTNYLGMDQSKLHKYYEKSEAQVKKNGFKYLSLEEYSDMPYFLEDPIHLSWRGWVQVDKSLNRFMKEPLPVHYPKTDPKYYFKKQPLQKNLKQELKKKN